MPLEHLREYINAIYELSEVRRRMALTWAGLRGAIRVQPNADRVISGEAWQLVLDEIQRLSSNERVILAKIMHRNDLVDSIVNPEPKKNEMNLLMTRLKATLTTYSDVKHPLTKKLVEEINAACDL